MLLVSGVIVNFDPYAKTGNRLFQFAFGKILAQQKNVPFTSDSIPGFSGTYNNSTNLTISDNPIKTISYGAQYVDYNALLTTKETVIVNSYLQKYSYYIEHLDFLRQLFKVEGYESLQVDKNELVIHIRGTDYLDGNVHINDEIFLELLDKISPSKASLVTDNINTRIVEELVKKGVSVVTKNNLTNKGNGLNEYEMYDFVYMLKANNLLISQSTFSWWPAFLGFQENIYIPYIQSKYCLWKLSPNQDDIDLIPDSYKYKKVIYS
jgi:hypothetical protein